MAVPMWSAHRIHTPTYGRPAIRRQRLLDALSEAMLLPDPTAVTVAMLSAPVGSGKTVLLSDWAARSATTANTPTIAWLTVTEDDNSRAAFAASSLAALRATGDPAVVDALRDVPAPDSNDFPTAIAEALGALHRPILMVLDDVHLLHDRETLETLGSFLQWAPTTLRTVLSGRFEPPLALHRMRLDGRVRDFPAHELAFTDDEAATLLAEHDVALDPADLATIQNRTQGWAAGLRLAAITLAHHHDPHGMITDFSGDSRVVADYLVGEVLDHLDSAARDFLVETSVPDAFNAELAETLTGSPDTHRFIDMLERENLLFEPVPGAPGWYRYHPLLREYLRAEAGHRGRQAVADLERVASRWFAESGADVRALRHSLHAGDDDSLQNLLCGLGFGAVLRGHADTVIDVLTQAPTRVRTHPVSRLVRAAAELDRGNEAAAASILGVRGAVADDTARSMRPTWAVPLEHALRLELAVRGGHIEHALTAIGTDPLGNSGEHDVDAFALTRLGIAEMYLGRFDQAVHHLDDGLAIARSAGLPSIELQALTSLATIGCWRCDLTEMTARADEAAAVARRHGLTDSWYFHLALVVIAWGDHLRMDRRAALDERTLQVLADRGIPAVAEATACAAGVLALDTSDAPQSTASASREHLLAAHRRPMPPILTALLAPAIHNALLGAGHATGAAELTDHVARTLGADSGEPAVLAAVAALHQRRPDAARAHLALVLAGDRGCTAVTTEILAWLTAAQIAHEKNDPIAVRDALFAALTLAEPQRIVRPFADAGAPVRELLNQNRGRFGVHDPFAEHVLSLLPAGPGRIANPLTSREMELLLELPSWRTAEQIAADLFVSVNTVKTHLRGIYRKLDVRSRREAINAARGLGLI
ncbi:LuxR C-terminal-related transcriptional regulator [Rhodococcus olei]|uniref:LuxR C-terminal-related transcriptional regulator n=1 Tax=Rhodococcus olei TaxID=2161675 RepID=A0ABP8P6T6_9NOCA